MSSHEHSGRSDRGHAGHVPASGDRQALLLTAFLTGGYFAVELLVGLWSDSVAVTSDAFHTFSAVGGVLIALVAQRLSERPASREHTFGWGRAEIVGALFNGVFLVVMAAYVFYMGAMRLMDPVELPTTVMLVIAFGGIATELVAFWLLYERQKANLNLKGAFWHVVQTFVGSLIIIVSAVVIATTGFLAIDPILGMAFGVVLFWASWTIIRSALRVLLEASPEDLDVEAAIAAIEGIDDVLDVHHVHAWSLTSGRNVFSAHIRVASLAADGERVLRVASDLLKKQFGVYFSTLQVEDERVPAEAQAAAIDITQGRDVMGARHGAAHETPGSRSDQDLDARPGERGPLEPRTSGSQSSSLDNDLSFEATPGPGDSDGGDVFAPAPGPSSDRK